MNDAQNNSHSRSLSELDISLLSKSKTCCMDTSESKEANLEYYTQFISSIEELLCKKSSNKCSNQYETVRNCQNKENINCGHLNQITHYEETIKTLNSKIQLLEENYKLAMEQLV